MLGRCARFICPFLLLIWSFAAFSGEGTLDDPLVFGVIPASSPERVLSDFGPLVDARNGISAFLLESEVRSTTRLSFGGS